MLERKRMLKHVRTETTDEGPVLVYEQPQTGDVFLIRDPQLRMDQVESVQNEVANLLRGAITAEPQPEAQATTVS